MNPKLIDAKLDKQVRLRLMGYLDQLYTGAAMEAAIADRNLTLEEEQEVADAAGKMLLSVFAVYLTKANIGFALNVSPYRDPEGDVTGYQITFIDTTEGSILYIDNTEFGYGTLGVDVTTN